MIKKYLNESLSSNIYRAENLQDFYTTIKNNRFWLSNSDTWIKKYYADNYYFLSTTRSTDVINNYFLRELLADNLTIIIAKLDASKLNQEFKSTPANFFYKANKLDYNNESEERILSKKPTISNAMSYIQHVYIVYGYAKKSRDEEIIQKIIEILNKNGISYYFKYYNKDININQS